MRKSFPFFFSSLGALFLLAMCCYFAHVYCVRHRKYASPEPILITALPNSGGCSVERTLSHFFHAPIFQLSEDLDNFADFVKKRGLGRFSSHPSDHRLAIMQEHLRKMIVHVRDPRQILVSWVHHLEKLNTHQLHHEILKSPHPLPEDYFAWNFHQKIDWQIEHFFKDSIAWLEAWLDFSDNQKVVDVKITSYDELHSAPLSFFKDVIAFYGKNPQKFKEEHLSKIAPGIHSRYRSINPQEWKSMLSPEQREYTTSLIPITLLTRFNWEV
ncbi:MAG: sulfotransferase domain-containing protein [Chlamydiales bacterium]